ncbi:MAG TPA: hypothetical protein VGN27_00130 [Gaiellaceae bacterium]|jgi:hypothetical protein|nr:hypothetical protein [Gaiellaceae bacterium]
MKAAGRLRSDERGIALLMALGIMVVLGIVVGATVSYTTSNTDATAASSGRLDAKRLAESGLNEVYSVLAQQAHSGGNPVAANLLGCNGASGPNDTTGPSNCTTPSPKLYCPFSTTCTAGSAGAASVYGYYSGTNAQTFLGFSVPASTWLLVSTGYGNDPATAGVAAHTSYAEVSANGVTSGSVAAMWNHVFLTAPLVPNVCQTNFSGNNMVVDIPLYVLGNLCLSGANTVVKEVGQPVDLEVGGKLVLNGANTSVGVSSGTPITSGVVVGGCTTVSVSSSTNPCVPASYRYWVGSTDTFNSQVAPSQTGSDIQNDYNTFDPGPKHACQSGTTPPPLASTVFDTNSTYDNSAASFELTPNASYSCISQNGAATGQLTWDNSAKKLTINGSIFIDGSMTISQSAYYVGTAILEVAGTVTMNGNNTTLCATSPCNTALTAWQGSSGNNSMLTLAPLASSTNALTLSSNNEVFQGSVWTQPSSTVSFLGNNIVVEGPMSIGSLGAGANNASLKPLPVIKNMPVGAPLPPNTGVTIGPMSFVGG